MSGTVRNHTRYVLVTYEGVALEDYVIFVDNSSAVTVYTAAGECFDGDLLALEALAALNKAYAVAVEPPPDFDGEVKEETHPEEETLPQDEKVIDWSEDPADETGSDTGVNLAHAEIEKEPVREVLDTGNPGGSPPVLPDPSTSAIPAEAKEQTLHLGVTPDGVLQGQGLYDGLVIADRTKRINLPGTVVPLDLIGIIKPEEYGTAFRKKSIPRRPMVLFRDLGNCIMGMPTWVGTTIAGPLRPDTGRKDPSIPDHDLWLEYGLPGD